MSKKSRSIAKTIVMVVIGLLLVLSVILNVVIFRKYNNLKKNPVTSEQQQKEELDRVVGKVGQLYKLPTDEKPDPFATVKDKELLKNQAFFKDAENGDYVLFYKNAKVAILYRESENRIINVGPLADDTSGQKASVHIFGSTDQAKAVKEKLKANSGLTYDTESAPAGTYAKVVVVDVSGTNKALASTIASSLGGDVATTLPTGETKPANAQIVIFAGQ